MKRLSLLLLILFASLHLAAQERDGFNAIKTTVSGKTHVYKMGDSPSILFNGNEITICHADGRATLNRSSVQNIEYMLLAEYTITYILDGEVYKTETYEYGATIIPLEVEIEGYIFSGWSEMPETMPAYDLTVYGTLAVDGVAGILADKDAVIMTLSGIEVGKVPNLSNLPAGVYIVKANGTTTKILKR